MLPQWMIGMSRSRHRRSTIVCEIVRSLHSSVPTGIVALVDVRPLQDLEASPPTSSFLSQTRTRTLNLESSRASAVPTAPAPMMRMSVLSMG